MKNPTITALVQELKKASIEQDVALWKRIAEDLECPSRQRRNVNVFKIESLARDGETLVFVEVKARATRAFGDPAEAITPLKRRRLGRMALDYLARLPRAPGPCRWPFL